MSQRSIINIDEVRDFFRENCEEEDKKFTEKKFKKFLECCEKDFYQWLRDNYKYFTTEAK